MRSGLKIAAALVGVQAALVGGYLLLGSAGRREEVKAQHLKRGAPELVYRTSDGAEGRLSRLRGQPVVVHFWATWCPPCREELPALLDVAAAGGIKVLAVSVDPDWPAVRHFWKKRLPPQIVLAPSKAAEAFGVFTLPETYVIDGSGQLRLRFAGAVDWRSKAVRARLREIK